MAETSVKQLRRSLAIEASLDRVRALTLAMNRPEDMVGICKSIATEMQRLGVKDIRNVQTAIFFPDRGTYMNYEYYVRSRQSLETEVRFDDHEMTVSFASRMMKGKGKFFSETIQGAKVQNWLAFQRTTNQYADPHLEKVSVLQYHWFSLGEVAIGLTAYRILTRDELGLFKRFRKVFEMSWRRYLDLARAEASAREARIEAALERVRARAMGLQTSGALSIISEAIFTELKHLGCADLRNAEIIVNNDPKPSITSYYYSDYGVTGVIEVNYNEHPTVKAWAEELKKGSDRFAGIVISEAEMESWRAYRVQIGYQPDPRLDQVKTVYYYSYSTGLGAISISSFSEVTQEQLVLLERFKNVFGLAYRRYADVAKAEAQAREVQIQLALERVRARTMAMQKSDELTEVANVLFQQIQELGIPAWTCGFNIWEKDELSCMGWMSTQGMMQPPFRIPLNESPTFIRFRESKLRGEEFFIDEVGGEALKAHYDYMLSLPDFNKIATSQIKAGVSLPDRQVHHVVNFKQGNLIFITQEPIPEFADIFKRVAKVFELTYTRFLDLQNAEAQAREAQVEVALERVRSKALAMHTSTEIKEVVREMRSQFGLLGEKELETCAIHLWDTAAGECEAWAALSSPDNTGNMVESELTLTIKGIRILEESLLHYQAGDKDYVLVNSVDKAMGFFEALRPHAPQAYAFLSKVIADLKPEDICAYWSVSDFEGGSLVMVTMIPPGDASRILLRRFANVFGLAYKRFQDIKKAEAQAREAQIELALERVRSKTMAMHNSHDVGDTVATLFNALFELGVKTNRCGILIFGEAAITEVWTAKSDPDGRAKLIIGHLNMAAHPLLTGIREAWKCKAPEFRYELNGDDLVAYYQAINATQYYPTQFNLEKLPSREYHTDFYFREGCIFSFTAEPVAGEAAAILKRFAAVFGQTYRRYLDLTQAEAQARESQIQLALERVRARTMAMQKSDELSETVFVLFNQFRELGEEPDQATIGIVNEKDHVIEYWVTMYGRQMDRVFRFSMDEPHVTNRIYKGWKENRKSLVIDLVGKELDEFCTYRESMGGAKRNPDEKQRVINVAFFSQGLLNVQSKEARSQESLLLLERFASVFEQTYTRFLDLKKAEAQAREAQVEAALERVRSRSLAMHHTSEIQSVIHTVHDELLKLDISIVGGSFVIINKDVKAELRCWGAGGTADTTTEVHVPHFNMPFCTDLIKGINKGPGVFTEEFTQQEKVAYFMELFKHEPWSALSHREKEEVLHAPGSYTRSVCVSKYTSIFIVNHYGHRFTDEENAVLVRFSNVFEQAYTRFLDLERSELQAREAQIELSLERVRSRAMAMQRPEELTEVAELLRKEMGQLGVEELETSSIYIIDKEQGLAECWYAIKDVRENDAKLVSDEMTIRLPDTGVGREMWEFFQSGNDQVSILMKGDQRKEWINYCAERSNVLQGYYGDEIPERTYHLVKFSGGYMGAASPGAISAESWAILKRLSVVFSLAYTRFIDLRNAIARARESQIELALERVRARTMAMQRSDELTDVAGLLFHQVKSLGIDTWTTGFNVWSDDGNSFTDYITSPQGGFIDPYIMPADASRYTLEMKQAREKQLDFIVQFADGEELAETYQKLAAHGPEQYAVMLKDGFQFPKQQYDHFVFGSKVSLMFITYGPVPEAHDIFKRFGKVFEQTYTRFQDLQKAEAQAREARIEAALERVRSRTMAMQSSQELAETSTILFREVIGLGLNPNRFYIFAVDWSTGEMQAWVTGEDGAIVPGGIKSNMHLHPVLDSMFQGHLLGETSRQIDLEGESLKDYVRFLNEVLHVPFTTGLTQARRTNTVAYFTQGLVGLATPEPIGEDNIRLMERFAKVFDLTYTRFQDLKRAEAQASDALRQASLDRVRAEIASMRTAEDLQRITPLVWRELTTLGVPFFRCGVFIMEEAEQKVHMYLSRPDGLPLAAVHVPFDSSDTTREAVGHWKRYEVYTTHWDREQFLSWVRSLMENGQLDNAGGYQGSIEPRESLTLQFLPFTQGMLYIGSTALLTKEQLGLAKDLADAFSVAYARYEDFTRLETAKRAVDQTLKELRAAQNQLVQSEKMASLGELTAGIAHEIQNPLNFVNNFSEVNIELADDLVTALDKHDFEEAKDLAGDIRGNQEKIREHGKRADGIVKSMLQHSRASTGQKEPTDLAALADEYLKLAYHGMRAKDKGFNVALETDFAPDLPKVNVIPQDIGRVLLNLYNNAFQAVMERKKSGEEGFEPKVRVEISGTLTAETQRRGANPESGIRNPESITLRVTDNGPGIPEAIRDKIFQPFFTTKPTGQGTGLGLSLSYDIVTKGHGGNLALGETSTSGTQFNIVLPIN